jgi:calcium-dependent protein kinase
VHLLAVYEDVKYFHLVIEHCSGGELFTRIIEVGHYSEDKAAGLMKMILLAVNFLHRNNIAHRDLKPENFLFEHMEENAQLKLIDFGLSSKFSDVTNEKMKSRVGTPLYLAPEVLAGHYDYKADLWSCGVILFILLSGRYPFTGETEKELFFNILNGEVDYRLNQLNHISDTGKDLVRKLLTQDAKTRIDAATALAHPWFQEFHSYEINIDPSVIDSLKRFKA